MPLPRFLSDVDSVVLDVSVQVVVVHRITGRLKNLNSSINALDNSGLE